MLIGKTLIFLCTSILLSAINEILCGSNEKIDDSLNRCDSYCSFKNFVKKTINKSVCLEKYARNSNNKCVPYEKCDCEENEELDRNKMKSSDPCIVVCKCKKQYRRNKSGKCEKFQLSEKDKSRCVELDDEECACIKCEKYYKLCDGRCHTNHRNCIKYDEDNCRCNVCKEGIKICNGKCFSSSINCMNFNNNTCKCMDNPNDAENKENDNDEDNNHNELPDKSISKSINNCCEEFSNVCYLLLQNIKMLLSSSRCSEGNLM